MMPIVMLVGLGRSGKDTAGEAIARELNGACVALADPIKRFVADVFKLTADQLWGKSKETSILREHPWADQCMPALSRALHAWKTPAELSRVPFERWLRGLPNETTPRHLMQSFGTECVRDVWPNFWIEHALWVADKLLVGGYRYDRELGLATADAQVNACCFTDGRFRNEVLAVRRLGGVVLRVWRPGEAVQAGFSQAAKAHASETEQVTIPAWWCDARIENDGTLGQLQGSAVSIAKHLLSV